MCVGSSEGSSLSSVIFTSNMSFCKTKIQKIQAKKITIGKEIRLSLLAVPAIGRYHHTRYDGLKQFSRLIRFGTYLRKLDQRSIKIRRRQMSLAGSEEQRPNQFE